MLRTNREQIVNILRTNREQITNSTRLIKSPEQIP